MGTFISKATNGMGAAVKGFFSAPFKTAFSNSCGGVCSGTWDLICFIEHLCLVSLVKLLMITCLGSIVIIFIYLLFKLGVCHCMVISVCKLCCVACGTYWSALRKVCGLIWYKIKHVKRVHRHRRHFHRHHRHIHDIEAGYSSSGSSSSTSHCRHLGSFGMKCRRKRKMSSQSNNHHKRSTGFSVHARGGGLRGSRNYHSFHFVRSRKWRRNSKKFRRRKRRRRRLH